MAEPADKAETLSFPELIRDYARLVYGTALRITGSDTDARIATRHCFGDLSRALPSIAVPVPAWLHSDAVKRSCLAAGRGILPGPAVQPVRRLDPHAVRRPDWKAVGPHVDEAIEKIPERVRLPVMLRHFLGYNQGRIANALDIDQSTVARRLDEGMGHLCRQLQKSGVAVSLASLASLLSRNAGVQIPPGLLAELQNMERCSRPPPLRRTEPPSFIAGPARRKKKPGCGCMLVAAIAVAVVAFALLFLAALRSRRVAPAPARPRPAGPIANIAVEPPMLVTVHLRDGQQVKGTPAFTSVVLRASFGEIELAIVKIREVSFRSRGEADVTLRNGDTVNGVVKCESLELLIDANRRLATPVAHIRRLDVRAIDPLTDRLTHGLLLHYSFNQGGERITDDSGNEHHGTFNGAPRPVQGVRGGALRFNGSSDYVVAPVTGRLRRMQSSDFTIAAWVKAHAIPEKSTDALAIVMKPGYNLGLLYGPDSMIRFDIYMRVDPEQDTEDPNHPDGIMLFRAETGPYSIEEWHHVVGVADVKAKRLLLYVDGKRVADAQWELDWQVLDYHRTEWCVAVAQPNGDTWRWAADATIDEVCLYDRDLSAKEVLDLFTCSGGNNLPPPEPSLATLRDADVRKLAKALSDKSLVARRLAARALFERKKAARPAMSALRRALDDGDPKVRMWSAIAMGFGGCRNAVPVRELINALHNEEWALSYNGALALAEIGPEAKDAVTPLIGAIAIRPAAVPLALGSIRAEPERVVPVLIKQCHHKLKWPRLQSAKALGRYGPDAVAAIPTLTTMLAREKDPDVRREVKQALAKIAGK